MSKKVDIKILVVVFANLMLLLPLIGNSQSNKHPRIYNNDNTKSEFQKSISACDWKNSYVEKKRKYVEYYIELCENDPEWLVSRLQMNWKTKHSNVYLKGGDFAYSDGKAPVPTVRYSGTRDWATAYKGMELEDIEPYFDDKRGYFLENKQTGKKEWVHPSKTGHLIENINQEILSIVEDASFLYWLTGEEKYAKLAKPVLMNYIEGMYYRNPPEVLDESNQRYISGLATFEVIHEKAVAHLCVAYDYLFNYFEQDKTDVSHIVAVLQKWGDQIIKYGIPDNNWNLFQARFLTYIALALDDDANYNNGKGQQYYLKYTFDESTPRQIAIKEALLVYDQQTGIWPESPSYSMHVNTTLLEILTLLDHATGANELANFPIIEKAALACFQYLFPSGNNVGFGDSGHGTIPFENFEMLIANYKKYNETEKELLITSLLKPYIEEGNYQRRAKSLFQLCFYTDELSDVPSETALETSGLMTPTFYAPNVSWFVQRMAKGDDAIMVSTAGSYGNHAHTNGISMELFANNYVQGPDMGKGSSYWSDDFRQYYAKMPAHNTVVVNGVSEYPNMRSYHPFSLDNHFPLSGEQNPLFKQVSFSKVSFVEPETKARQQRLTAIVNTPSGKAYVLDLFRSKTRDGEPQKHEYFYHNLGHTFELLDKINQPLTLNETLDLSSKGGQLKAYDYLSDKKSVVFGDDLKALFTIKEEDKSDNFMQIWIKGHENQSIYSVNSPKSNALAKGGNTAPKSLIGKKMPTLILQRNQEAWHKPFVLIFNPFFQNSINPLSDVVFDEIDEKSDCQFIKVSHADELTQDFILANTSENDIVETDDVYQMGLLSVVREKEDDQNPEFIFVSGVFQFRYKKWQIIAINTPVTVSIEKEKDHWWVQNDQPVLLKVPISSSFKPAAVRLFHNDGSYEERKGNINRNNPNQIEFRFEKAYKKALIISE
jgi:hypothetical protein